MSFLTEIAMKALDRIMSQEYVHVSLMLYLLTGHWILLRRQTRIETEPGNIDRGAVYNEFLVHEFWALQKVCMT